jgi:hypothetical protein
MWSIKSALYGIFVQSESKKPRFNKTFLLRNLTQGMLELAGRVSHAEIQQPADANKLRELESEPVRTGHEARENDSNQEF